MMLVGFIQVFVVKQSVTRFAVTMAAIFTAPFLSCLPSSSADFGAPPAIGQAAPDFSLSDTKGKTHELSSYKGKYVVLEWFNDGCPFVKKHYGSKNMQNLQKEYTKKGVVWLTINSSAEGKQGFHQPAEYDKLIADEDAHPTALLLDHDGKVGHIYGAKTTPDMFVINKKGVLVYSGAIDSIASADTSDIAKATNYVKQTLDDELSGKDVKVATTKSYGCPVKYAD
jgi:peroxiredoxin